MDDLIDRALSTYVPQDAPPGLEQRILATARPRRRWFTLWLLAPAVAACAVALLLTLTLNKKPNVPQALPPVEARQSPAKPDLILAPEPPAQAKAPVPHHHRLPKRDVFPSPAAIPESELAFARFVAANPELARSLVAESSEPNPISIEPLSIKLLDED